MNSLYILPTSRAIRERKSFALGQNALLPKYITIGDFESRAVILDSKSIVDSSQRVFFLKDAANFDNFKFLKSDLNLLKFYSQSQEFFSFFEELSADLVDINTLYSADYYAEFDRDIDILKELINNYEAILDKNGLTDRAFIPKSYRLNLDYINSFDDFILELEGFLTKFELQLFEQISKIKPFTIKLRTCQYNKKMIDSFLNLGINLKDEAFIEFDLSKGKILTQESRSLEFNCEVIETKERLEQIAVSFSKIEEFVTSGIKPDKIALITPDESMAELIKDFDSLGNFNLAMGFKYSKHLSFRAIYALKEHLNGEDLASKFLDGLGFDFSKLKDIQSKLKVERFFEVLKELNLPLYSSDDLNYELDKINLLKSHFKFCSIFSKEQFSLKEWLFLWINEIGEHTLDDIGGGEVTIMGVLESRGINFEAVVIIDFNEDVVPSISKKDRFLNTQVRENASLPTKSDRENLQKYYYARILEKAKSSCIIYHTQDGLSSSKFLYELNLSNNIKRYKTPLNILFNHNSKYKQNSFIEDKELEFNAKDFIWSATSLKIFLECKRRFFYRYMQGIKEPKSDELNEGSILHNILSRVFYSGLTFNSKDELKELLLKEIAKEESNNLEIIYKKLMWSKLLEPFIETQYIHLNSGWSISGCEIEVSGEISGLKFKGYIDRLDKKDSQYLVIDYKSGKVNNSKDVEKLSDFQMNIYQKLLDKPVNSIDFAYIKILDNPEFEFLEAQEAKELKLLEHIEYIKEQESILTSRCENLQICRYCPYQLLCHRGDFL